MYLLIKVDEMTDALDSVLSETGAELILIAQNLHDEELIEAAIEDLKPKMIDP